MIIAKGVGMLPTRKIIGVNRMGSATVLGGVYAVDVTGSATESTDADSNLTSIVAVASANMRGWLVVADGVYADNEAGIYTLEGRCQVLVDGTTDITEGLALIPVNAAANLITQGAGSLLVGCAIALEAYTDTPVVLKDVFFNGDCLFKATTPAS